MIHSSAERLQALVEGTLDRETETALLAHLEGCDTCLESFEQASAVHPMRLGFGTEQGDPSLFRRRLMHRINYEQTKDATVRLVVTGFVGLLAFVLKTVHPLLKGVRTHTTSEQR